MDSVLNGLESFFTQWVISGMTEFDQYRKQHSFKAEVNGGWEWFVTTIIGLCQTESIAVTNRSHNK
jgi:hypothetical protein